MFECRLVWIKMYSVNPEGNVSSYLEVAKSHKKGEHNMMVSLTNINAGRPRLTTRETKLIQNVPEPNMVQPTTQAPAHIWRSTLLWLPVQHGASRPRSARNIPARSRPHFPMWCNMAYSLFTRGRIWGQGLVTANWSLNRSQHISIYLWIIKCLFCIWRIEGKPCTLTLGG